MKKIVKSLAAVASAVLVFAGCASTGSSGSTSPQYTQKGWKSVKIHGGGMVPGLIYNTSKQGVLYARTDMGGAYRFDAASQSWIPLTDFAGVEDYGRLGIASIATDPVEPNRLVIASGTYTNDWEKGPSQMLVSEDYGNTFKRIDMYKSDGTPLKMGGNMPGRGAGERLAIDPNNNKIVYFGSFGDGLYRSEDYGHTWKEVKSFPAKGNVYDEGFSTWSNFNHYFGIMWVVFDPESGTPGNGSKNIYCGVADTKNTIYESNDAGATWHPLEGQPRIGDFSYGKPEAQKARGEAKHKHMTGEVCSCHMYYPLKGVYSPKGELLVSYNAGFGPYSSAFWGGAIWKFNFKTREWTDISLPKHDPDPSYATTDRAVGSVAVDYQNPDVLIAVTMNEWWPDEYIYRSTDGGATWDPIWYLDGYPNRVDKYSINIKDVPWLDWGTQKTLPEESPKLGWCIADIEIDPFDSDRMMYGTGAGIYSTGNLTDWDRGKRVNFIPYAEGIEECAVLELISPTEGAHLISGVGDIGGFVHYDLTKASPMIVNPNISGVSSLDYAAEDPYYIIRMGDGKLMISYDGGDEWNPVKNYIQGANEGWGGTAAVNADSSVIVWAPSNLVPSWTDDEGEHWNVCSGLPENCKVVSDRVNKNRFYAYGGDKKFYASTDGGKSFVMVNDRWNKSGKDSWQSDLNAVIGCEEHLWFAAGEAGLYHSEDGGITWTSISGFDDALVIGLGKAKDSSSYQVLYTNSKYKGKYGIYMSEDKGVTWTRINDDNHQYGAANTAITRDPRVYGRVYLGTNGRGIVYRDVFEN